MLYASEFPKPPDYWLGPPKNSVDWLWYKFTLDDRDWKTGSLLPAFLTTSICTCCDTFGVLDPNAHPPKCWCCGKFLKVPDIMKPQIVKKNQRLWG